MVVSCSFAFRTHRKMPDVRVPLAEVLKRASASRNAGAASKVQNPWVKLPQIKDRVFG